MYKIKKYDPIALFKNIFHVLLWIYILILIFSLSTMVTFYFITRKYSNDIIWQNTNNTVLNFERWYIYQMSINDNHTCKKIKIQGMMNWLIYWLFEELMFVMIYQCHHCCVLLFVRRQHILKKNLFVRESTLFPIQKIVVLLLVNFFASPNFQLKKAC